MGVERKKKVAGVKTGNKEVVLLCVFYQVCVCVCQAQTGEWVRLVWQNNLHELSVSQQLAFK